MNVLIVIPAFNEGQSIKKTITDLKKKCSYDFIVVNDGSSDNTEEICIENKYPLLNLPVNLGLSGAFTAGMKFAYRNGYDAVLQFDGDGQHLPEYIDNLVSRMAETKADIVIGSRFVKEKKPFSTRMVGSALITFLIKLTTGKKIKDPTSGMRLWNRTMISEFAHEINITPEPDTVSYLITRGAKVEEIQVKMQERLAGESYLNFTRSIMYMSRMLISILLVQPFRGKKKLLH